MEKPLKRPARIFPPKYIIFDPFSRQMDTCTDLGVIAHLINKPLSTVQDWFRKGKTEKAYNTLHIFKVHSHISGNRKGHYHDKLLGKKIEEEN